MGALLISDRRGVPWSDDARFFYFSLSYMLCMLWMWSRVGTLLISKRGVPSSDYANFFPVFPSTTCTVVYPFRHAISVEFLRVCEMLWLLSSRSCTSVPMQPNGSNHPGFEPARARIGSDQDLEGVVHVDPFIPGLDRFLSNRRRS